MVNNLKMLILAGIVFSGPMYGMSYEFCNGDLAEADALAVALSLSADEHQDQAATRIQALYKGWFQRKKALNGKIHVQSYFRTVYQDGTYTTRHIPTIEAQATFEEKTIPMAQLQHARQLFVRLGMTPFAHVINIEKVESNEKAAEVAREHEGAYVGPLAAISKSAAKSV